MEAGERLKDLLQHQLATDVSSVKHLSYVVSYLAPGSFQSSPHLAKWLTRINSLIHSKEPSARWAGLCLAYKTSILSQELMVESAQTWVGTVLPLLSRNEPPPTTKAAIRLLRTIFTTAMNKAEFQRQISTPNVVKFSTTLMNIAPSYADPDVKALIFETLSELVASYPTTHRPVHAQLTTFSLAHLDGSAHTPTNRTILDAASKLFARLPLTGGKVGSIALWRKSADDCLAFGWTSFRAIRTTFPGQAPDAPQPPSDDSIDTWIPLNLDRLRCSVVALQHLLSVTTQRPVQVPLGRLSKLTVALLGVSSEGKADGFVNPLIRSMEISVVPSIRQIGCELLVLLTERFGKHITQNQQLATLLAMALEEKPAPQHQLPLLRALNGILARCTALESGIVLNRLTKVITPIWKSAVVSSGSSSASGPESSATGGKRGKKRAKQFDGDEVFQNTPDNTDISIEGIQNALVAIEVTKRLFRVPFLPVASQSTIARTVVSSLLILPRQPASSITKPDPAAVFLRELSSFAIEVSSGTTSVMSKALPFVLSGVSPTHEDIRYLETLLHPRAPPLVRAVPQPEEWTFADASPAEPPKETNAIVVDSQPQPPPLRPNPLPVPQVASKATPAVTTFTPLQPTLESRLQSQPQPQQHILPVPAVAKSQASSPAPTKPPSISAVTSSTQNLSLSNPPPPPVAGPSQPRPAIVATQGEDEDEDEEMPAINMDSDTDDEEGDEDMG